MVRHENTSAPVRLYVCARCRQSGGTLIKKGDVYVHEQCPVPRPIGMRRARNIRLQRGIVPSLPNS